MKLTVTITQDKYEKLVESERFYKKQFAELQPNLIAATMENILLREAIAAHRKRIRQPSGADTDLWEALK